MIDKFLRWFAEDFRPVAVLKDVGLVAAILFGISLVPSIVLSIVEKDIGVFMPTFALVVVGLLLGATVIICAISFFGWLGSLLYGKLLDGCYFLQGKANALVEKRSLAREEAAPADAV